MIVPRNVLRCSATHTYYCEFYGRGLKRRCQCQLNNLLCQQNSGFIHWLLSSYYRIYSLIHFIKLLGL